MNFVLFGYLTFEICELAIKLGNNILDSVESKVYNLSDYRPNSALQEVLEVATFPDYGDNHLICMLNVRGYFDASGNHDQADSRGRFSPAVVVAGYLGTKLQWEQFDGKWKAMLAKYKVPYFHANKFNSRQYPNNPYYDWSDEQVDTFRFDAVSVIKDIGLYGVGASVLAKDYEKVITEIPNSIRYFQSPYCFCAYLCLMHSSQWAKDNDYKDSIEYIFESGDDHQGQILDAHIQACKDWETRKHFHLAKGGLSFQKKHIRPLQSADGLAHGMYKELFRMAYQSNELHYTRKEFVPYAKIQGVYKYNLEDDLIEYLKTHFADELKRLSA